jgi:hypothetical protein
LEESEEGLMDSEADKEVWVAVLQGVTTEVAQAATEVAELASRIVRE